MAASKTRTELPQIACELDQAGLEQQTHGWRRVLRASGRGAIPTGDGIRVMFCDKPETEDQLNALIKVENRCCSWAHWDLLHEPGRLVVRATADGHGVTTLQEMLKAIGRAIPDRASDQ